MNTHKKLLLITLVTLLAVSAFTAYVCTAEAQSTLNFETSISASDPTVNSESSYTFTLTNTGADSITGANITMPAEYLGISNLQVSQQPVSGNWNVDTADGVILAETSGSGLSNGQSVTLTFEAHNAQVAGDYTWATDVISAGGATSTINSSYKLQITSFLPVLAILGIAVGIAFLNSGINRILINYFIGWEQYRVMQKEMAEFRSEQMAAARANDKKQMEKLKRKQSQINNMQSKMMKPQMLQIGISFLYLIVWFLVLIPTFGNTSLAYLPGFGPIAVVWLYPICSLFLGLIASRIIGIMPIDNTQ